MQSGWKNLPNIALLMTGMVLPAVQGAEITLPVLQDTTIYEEGALSNGAGEHLFAGNTAVGNARRALLQFSLSGIPSGSTIVAASVQLTVSKTTSGPSSQSLYRLTQSWTAGTQNAPGEEGGGTAAASGDATWAARQHPSPLWSTPGGDLAGSPSATASVGGVGVTVTWTSAPLAADVQNWLDGALSNNGWALVGDEVTPSSAKRFYSSDNMTALPQERPRLIVNYTAPPTPTPGPPSAGMPAALWRALP